MAHLKASAREPVDYSQDLNGILTFDMYSSRNQRVLPAHKLTFLLESILPPVLGQVIYDYCNPLQDIIIKALLKQPIRGHDMFVEFIRQILKPIRCVRSYDGVMGCFMMVRLDDNTIIGFGKGRSVTCPKVTQIRVDERRKYFDHFTLMSDRCNDDVMYGGEFPELDSKISCVQFVRVNFEELKKRRALIWASS